MKVKYKDLKKTGFKSSINHIFAKYEITEKSDTELIITTSFNLFGKICTIIFLVPNIIYAGIYELKGNDFYKYDFKDYITVHNIKFNDFKALMK